MGMKEQGKAGHFTDLFSLGLPVLLFAMATGWIIYSGLSQTGGSFIYPVDDAYIHMQIARNLSTSGSWGIIAGEFNSASSSPLYTILLWLAFLVFGNHILIPLLINILSALVLLYMMYRWLQGQGMGRWMVMLILAAAVFITPLPLLVMTGMEHTLQCLFTFLFLFGFADWLQRRPADKKFPVRLLIYAVLVSTIRYEGLFLVGMACLYLLYRRQLKNAVLLGGVALLPLIAFGIYSVSKGSYFLPNSVLVKSEAAQFSLGGLLHAMGHILEERLTFSKTGIALLATQRLLLILPLAYLVFLRPLRELPHYAFLLLALTGATFLQLTLADTGKFYRYEAYLMLCATILLSVLLVKFGRSLIYERYKGYHLFTLLVAFFLLLPLVLRSVIANTKIKQASVNIHDQQIQMSRFIRQYYNGNGVAANDIGAIAYFTQAKIVDLWGLGDIDIARSKKGGYWTSSFLDSVSRKKGASIAIVYDSWIDASLPAAWKKAGEWKIVNNVVCGDDYVSFYAIDSSGFATLKRNLLSYQPSLPATVKVTYQ